MADDRAFTRRLLQTVFAVAGVVILIAALWASRAALRLIYVSAIIAMGFSPLVGLIERKSSGKRRVPRTLAILVVYLVILAVFVTVGVTVIPPLIEQGGELWAKAPGWFNDVQRSLIRYRLMAPSSRSTLAEAVQSAPKSGTES